jgi:hypothetical protein
MSDTFDHMGDAYLDRDNRGYEDFPSKEPFVKDPLFYHTKIKYDAIDNESPKAISIDGLWIPKSLCREFDKKNQTVYVLTNFWVRKQEEKDNEKSVDLDD